MDLNDVAAALGVVVLERVAPGRFVRIGAPTTWWCQRAGADAAAAVDVVELFPFLGVFMPVAETLWTSRHKTPLASDMWTEMDPTGHEYHLEAFATCVGGDSVLVISRNDQAFLQRQLLVQRARELRATYDALMREIERKDILLHTIVHDLTAPLHSIVGSLSLLRECDLPPKAMRWTELAIDAAARQRALISEILDVFVSEHGSGAAHETMSADLTRAIQRAVAEREPVARQRQIQLVTSIEDVAPVVADETRLLRVLTNLLDNAIRHSPAGRTVQLTSSLYDDSLQITVDDEGPGVAAQMLPRLFDKFAHDPRAGGTGLGLYFCRITIEQWGGGIGYEPRTPAGSRFWIRLPISAPEHDHQRGTDHHDEVAVAR